MGFRPVGRPIGTAGGTCAHAAALTLWRVLDVARGAALTAAQAKTPLARKPYDLRHAGVSLRLNAGVQPTQVAEWAGHGVEVFLKIYAKVIAGQDRVWEGLIDDALGG